MPLTPAIVEEVLEGSGPVDYGSRGSWASNSLRPFVLRYLCTFEFCTVVEFMDYVECFELDGAFAAEIMKFLASEMKWAVDRWGAHMGASIDVTEKKRQILEEEGNAQCIAKSPKTRKGVWLALRYMCTFSGCQTTDFRAYSQCFELDGGFAAEILNYMVRELRWIVEVWGKERGWTVDVAREREDEAYDLQERSDLEHTVQKYMRRGGWS